MTMLTAGPPPTPAPAPSLRVTCWGSRGSIPSPGPDTTQFGGNTACIEVRDAHDRCYIFDGGTGIRSLGHRLSSEGAVRANLFLTHFHWDHIQGLPFFSPLYDPQTFLRVHAAQQGNLRIDRLFARQMSPMHFPVPFEAIGAEMDFVRVNGEPWSEHGTEVHAIRMWHSGVTYGYRIRSGGVTVAYLPDNELPFASRAGYRRLVQFLEGVDLLIHDAMYTEREYTSRVGWGHSTFQQAVHLAADADARRLWLFHHAPDRSDVELTHILDELRGGLARRGFPLCVDVATEGSELLLKERLS